MASRTLVLFHIPGLSDISVSFATIYSHKFAILYIPPAKLFPTFLMQYWKIYVDLYNGSSANEGRISFATTYLYTFERMENASKSSHLFAAW